MILGSIQDQRYARCLDGQIPLAELIKKLKKFKRNAYWCIGWRLKYHIWMYGHEGRKTSLARPYF